jgi:hypothetical protein
VLYAFVVVNPFRADLVFNLKCNRSSRFNVAASSPGVHGVTKPNSSVDDQRNI